MTITEFLTARLDEDEAVARAGISSQADPESGWGYITEGVSRGALTPHVGHIHEEVQAAHITRWHPYRVLAEVEAKRRIVALYRTSCVTLDENSEDFNDTPEERGAWDALEDVVSLLALPYADHPDYDERWRP